FDTDGEPPASQDWKKQIESGDEAEFDVARALISKGHEVRLFGFRDGVDHLTAGIRAEPADVIFNLSEGFGGKSGLDYTVAAVLDMLGLPYTGASSEGLMLARDKALTKKVFAYQGIRIPHFMVCPRGGPTQRPSDLRFPLIVKPQDEDASVGIAQASVVRDGESRDIQNMVAKNLSADVRKRLAEVAVRAYEAAGLHDYGRIDVRLAH